MKYFYIFHTDIQIFVQHNIIKQDIVVINKEKDIIIFIAHTQGHSLEHTHAHTHTICLYPLSELSTLGKKHQGVEKSKVILNRDSSSVIPVYRNIAKEYSIIGINLTVKYVRVE